MLKRIGPYQFTATSRGYRYFRISALIYSLIELAFMFVSASIGMYLQFYTSIASISFQIIAVISTIWMLYKSSLVNIKYCIIASSVGILGYAILLPIMRTWSIATQDLCGDVLSYSDNSVSVSLCTKLVTARYILTLIITVEISLKCAWVVICLVGYKIKISLLNLIEQAKERIRERRRKELEYLKEKERRRKERRRKELKDKIMEETKR